VHAPETRLDLARGGNFILKQATVILTGVGGDRWHAFAQSLTLAPARSKSTHYGDENGALENKTLQLQLVAGADAEIAALLSLHRSAKFVAFWEPPLDVVVNAVRSGASADCAKALGQWAEDVAPLLVFWRKNRERFLLLAHEECVAAPAAAIDRLSRFAGYPLIVDSATNSNPQPLAPSARLLAEAIVKRHREAFRVVQELSAASPPLEKIEEYTTADPAIALEEVLFQGSALAAAQRERKQLALRVEELENDGAKLRSELEKLRATNAENCAMLLKEIEHAHQESEDFFQQLEHAQADAEAVKQQLGQSRTLLHEAGQAKHALEAERDESQHRISQLHAELDKLRQSALDSQEHLLQEIQNAHRESEDFFEQWKSLEAATQPEHFVAERIVRGGERHQPPHNHIDYTFDGATLFERHWPQLRVRLAEHGGNAGIVIFETTGSATQQLYHWEPNGKENGADYMLFVPRDKKSAAKLVGLPASDLILVRGLAAKMLGDLCVHGGNNAARWADVARRLLHEIDEIPERLHYDSVAGHAERNDGEDGIRFTAAKLAFRGDCTPSFGFHWSPGSHGGRLRIGPDTPMLPSCGGEAAVGFESDEDASSLEKLWPRLTARDRTFLLLLAKALPDFVYHLCQQQPDHQQNKGRLTNQAKSLYRKLRAFDHRQSSRGMLAKLFRRSAKIPYSCLFVASVLI
jgi:hypothetical protein